MSPEFETVVLKEFPAIHSRVYTTEQGTHYLQGPGVVLIAAPSVNLEGMRDFLRGFPADNSFADYLDDPVSLPPAEQLSKTAGQTCYASFGPKRTYNQDAGRYIGNIITSGHGSVLEHANFSVLMYGVSRDCTHELVRHRAGMAYSQLSQRYVGDNVLRFVERLEYQNDPELHGLFLNRIDRAKREYEEVTEKLLQRQQEGDVIVSAEAQTDRRKKVRQAARSLLPNETEASIIVTGNVRAWRHVISMRANEHADIEIRRVMFNTFLVLKKVAPVLFSDYEMISLPDGTGSVKTLFPKV